MGSRRLAVTSTAALVAVLATALTPLAAAPAVAVPGPPDGVSAGSGSYAPTPPEYLGQHYQDVLNRPLFIEDDLAGQPVPTNAWWTDLAVSRYSGDMWANPFVVSNSAEGTTLRYPTRWNEEGTNRVLESPLVVGGTVTPTLDPSDVVMADFEDGTVPEGWTATGTAFNATSAGTAPGQMEVTGFLGRYLLNSFTADAGDGATGSLRSPLFPIDRSTVAFKVAGGDHVGRTEVRLVVDGETVRAASGSNSESLAWVTWDVAEFAGRSAHIEIVDDLPAGWAHILVDQIMRTDAPEGLEERFDPSFAPDSATAAAWGDWNLSWRMANAGGSAHIDATAARGIPFTWFEFDGVLPRLTLAPGARVLAADGAELETPAQVDRLIIEQDGRRFGVHAPDSAAFELVGRTLSVTGAPYLVVSAMPDEGLSLDDLHEYAFAVPRDTRMDYVYDPAAAQVVQDWSIRTEPLEGGGLDTIQGFLPHHYRGTGDHLAFTGATYDTSRGLMQTSIGHEGWRLDYGFEGLLPGAPTPESVGGEDDYSVDVMRAYVRDYARRTEYGADTYWGGKTLQEWAQYMLAAKQIGETEAYETLRSSLRTALTDWFTFTDGERSHFFARYPTWGAMVGFQESYGSAEFTDNHFHYGYFTLAAGILAMEDPQWAAEYGQMATLVAQQYANWDRSSTDFPYLRTFDTWAGHSYAGGTSSPGGNNQESSSEAMQSWYGLFLLGTALGDTDMQATGAMGYSTERQAVLEYWLDYHGNPAAQHPLGEGNFPAEYDHSTTGILFDSGQAFATYFSGDPSWIYGIQWMPTGQHLDYLSWDRTFSLSLLQDMFDLRPQEIGENGTRGENAGRLQMWVKRWYGIGTWGADPIARDRPAAIEELKAAVRAAELHHPGWVTERRDGNPFWDAATDTFFVTRNADGTLGFSDEYWTPETIPASLVPPEIDPGEVDRAPQTWATRHAVIDHLALNFEADDEAIRALYRLDLTNYEPGRDTAHAADVFSRIGEALGNVVLGMLAHADPDIYADVHAELLRRGDAVATARSMAGLVYWKGMADRSLGAPAPQRWTSSPTSQVYYDADSDVYSYAVYNPSDRQERFRVFDGGRDIGWIDVPARTQVTHHLDARLDRIEVAGDVPARTVEPGTTIAYTATGYDQYGAVVPLEDLAWSAEGGEVTSTGAFTAGEPRERATVTATSGATSGSASVRIGPAPVLTTVAVTPAFARVESGSTETFRTEGLDQYGDPIALGDAVRWEFTGAGSIDENGVLTGDEPGGGHVVATVGEREGSAVAAVVAPLADVALGAAVSATSTLGQNTAGAAVDGDAVSRWESRHGSDDESLTVDLGARFDLARVRIGWEAAAAARYRLEVADTAEGPWRTLRTVEKADAADDVLDIEGSGRFVRVQGESRLTAYGYSIEELEVFGTRAVGEDEASTVLVAPRRAVVAPGSTAGFSAYAFDAAGNGGAIDAQWDVSEGPGTVDGGRFTAPAEPGRATLRATFGAVQGEAEITIGSGALAVERNVAAGKTATASSRESESLDAGFAVDGRATTRWSSAHDDAQHIEIDLGESVAVTRVVLDWEAAHARSYQLQVRDTADAPWRTVVHETNGRSGRIEHDLGATPARFVRMLGEERATGWGYSLTEFEVFSREGGSAADLTIGAAATASTEEGPFAAAHVIDGDPQTRWASAPSDDEWLTIDLGSAQPVAAVELEWEDAFGRAYRIEGATAADGPWRTLAAVTEGDGASDAVPLTPATVRYVRLSGIERGTVHGYSLYSVVVR